MRDNDAWYESEELTRNVMIYEVQRIRRRARVHRFVVFSLTAVLTAAITYKLVTRKQHFEAEVVLALREGALANPTKNTGMPLGELRELVRSVLLTDAKLGELIERRNLERLRHRLGMQWAINELREQISIEVWRNTFVYYDPEQPNREASARIGISVTDDDPDQAFLLARDVAAIIIDSLHEHRMELAHNLADQIQMIRKNLEQRLSALELEKTDKMVAMARAKRDGKAGVVQAYHLRLSAIDRQQRDSEKSLHEITTSQDALADQIAAAGLDLVMEVVDERRPSRPENQGLWIAIAIIIVGIGALCGSALFVGAFDSRVHDVDDIERLGLPVLGHVPGFPGDRVGALGARGVQRSRLQSR